MTDGVLNILKLVFLGLLYLFFVRVLWVVGNEVRAGRPNIAAGNAPGQPPNPMPGGGFGHAAEPSALPVVEIPGQPVAPMTPAAFLPGAKPKKGKKGNVARLTIIEPRARRGQAFPITYELTIGRSAGCTIQVLDDTFISSVHCRIFRDEAGNAIVEDVGSTNGTYLNGDRIHVPKPLHQGDRIQLGGTIVEAQ